MREDRYGGGGSSPGSLEGRMMERKAGEGCEIREVGEASAADYGNMDGTCEGNLAVSFDVQI